MPMMRRLVGLIALALPASLPAMASPPTTLDHEVRFAATRFSLSAHDGKTEVEMLGAGRESSPGHPDLPVVAEMVELPAGVRAVGVDLLSFDTALLSAEARIPPALAARPSGPGVRTEPDAAVYGRAGFAPATSLVTLGYQGWMRGRHVAWLRVNPVRWDPASGRLERLTRLKVRLALAPHSDAGVAPRERIVPEWEDGASLSALPRPSGFAADARQPEPFRATQVPSVMGSPVAYVIITEDSLAAEFQRLADWKTQSGVPAVVRTMSFIRDQYPAATDDADRVRQFIRDAYSRWSTKWVLLGGDTSVLPFRFTHSNILGGDDIPTDLYFSCLDGNWDGDGDGIYGEPEASAQDLGDNADLLPEVYVGRVPVASNANVHLYVDKDFQYTRTPVGDYEHTIEFLAEVITPHPWSPPKPVTFDGADMVEEILPSVQTIPGLHSLRFYQNYTNPNSTPGSLPELKARALDSLNAGYNMLVHVGHGYRSVMSVGDGSFEIPDILNLTNGNRLTNVYSIDCTSNAIDFPCIGEAFLLAPNGGAVSNVGSTRVDFPSTGRMFEQEYFRLMFEDSVTAVGEAQARQKLPFTAQATVDNIYRWIETTLLLLGDPELHQWIGKPRTLTVTHPPTYTVSDTSMTVNVSIAGVPLFGARVTAWKSGDDYRSVTTNGAGNAVLDFRPGSTGSFYLTVTGFNCKPSQETLTVGAAAGSAIAELTPIVDDDAVGGTIGNADGQPDAGETIDLKVPLINKGGTSASSVTATLSTSDALVAVTPAAVSYGTLGPGASANGTGAFRLTIPTTCPDQREVPFTLSVLDGAGKHYSERFSLTVRASELRQVGHTYQDVGGGGNGNGVPEPGETVTLLARVRNMGTGRATGVTAKLRNYDGMATVLDSTAAFGDMVAGQEVAGDAMTFTVGNTAAKLELRLSDSFGLRATQMVDLLGPDTPTALAAVGSQREISLTWNKSVAADLQGYNVYRNTAATGTFTKVNAVPTDRVAYYQDEALAPLTTYYYKVTAVDSSGNESIATPVIPASTNPPTHALFPIEMGRTSPASVAVDRLYQQTTMDIVAGSNVLYVWHADATAPVDADGSPLTLGDFTTRGSNYAAGASLARLDNVNWSIVAPSWDSLAVYVFDTQGNVRPGWPFATPDPVWSAVAIGDLNNDGSLELVFGSNGNKLYALRANGTEWRDGDSNPATKGVFKVLGASYNYGTPALADLDKDGQLDILYASTDGKLYAWRPDGTNLPGFPVTIGANTSSSVAVGDLDGPSDTQLDIVVTSANDSLYVFKADGGRHAGFPKGIRFHGTSRNPSPALADMDGDGFTDIVVASTDGAIYVVDHNGVFNPTFASTRFSAITNGAATESSPVVADINGDNMPDIVVGDENGMLAGISGNGQPLPGFPIQLGAEVRGTPALCDCDGDGKTEIAVSSWDQKTYMWDYDFPFSPGGPPPWPQFHHDARRTGLAIPASAVGVDPDPPLSLRSYALDPPTPNPARANARVAWAVPSDQAGADLDLSVYDLAGRRVVQLAGGKSSPGRSDMEWNLRSSSGSRIGEGIYFLRLQAGTFSATRKLVVLP